MLRRKLSSRETVLLLVVVVVLVAALGLRYPLGKEVSAQEELEAKVRRAGVALDEARVGADLPPLEAKKQDLTQQLEKTPPLVTESGEVSLQLWGWAVASGVTLRRVDYAAAAGTVAGTTMTAHKYTLTVQGEAAGLHRFLTAVTTSRYRPGIEALTLSRSSSLAGWDLGMSMTVYSQEKPPP